MRGTSSLRDLFSHANVPNFLQEFRQSLVLQLEAEALFTVGVSETAKFREDAQQLCKHHILPRPAIVHVCWKAVHINLLEAFGT